MATSCSRTTPAGTGAQDSLLHIIQPAHLIGRHQKIELIVILDLAHRLQCVGGGERVGQVVQREMIGGKTPWIGVDLHLAGIPTLHLHAGNARHGGEQRHHLVAGDDFASCTWLTFGLVSA